MFDSNDHDPYAFDDTTLLGERMRTSRDNRGLCRNQKPLSPRYTMPEEATRQILIQVGCRDLAQIKVRALEAIGTVFANLTLAPSPSRIFYSRDRGHYAGRSRYLPRHFSHRRVTHAIDTLEERRLVSHRKTWPSQYAKLRSFFSAGDELAELLKGYGDTCSIAIPKELVVLRDAKRCPMDYVETDETRCMRCELTELNEFLSDVLITIEHPDAIVAGTSRLIVNDRLGSLGLRTLYRVFTQTFRENGRFYGGFWQNLPKAIRWNGLRIDNQPVVELDYRACHLRILCELVGRPMPFHDPDFDPFSTHGFERRLVKDAFVILLNTRTNEGALKALAHKLAERRRRPHPDASDFQLSRKLLEVVDSTFPFLRPYWCKRYGLRLLNIDAAICAENLRQLKSHGVPSLPVHDSFIVPAQHRELLHTIMECGFVSVMKDVRA